MKSRFKATTKTWSYSKGAFLWLTLEYVEFLVAESKEKSRGSREALWLKYVARFYSRPSFPLKTQKRMKLFVQNGILELRMTSEKPRGLLRLTYLLMFAFWRKKSLFITKLRFFQMILSKIFSMFEDTDNFIDQ